MKGFPPGGAGGPHTANGDVKTTYFNPRNAEDIFAEFFGGGNPFNMGGMGSHQHRMGGARSPFGDGIFGGFGGTESVFRNFVDPASSSSGPRKAAPVENKLPCSLEELYAGSTRKMKISRNIADPSGYVKCLIF